ncbi:MAG: META domain-containing protein [Xanthomonadales bacterium]|nr:META domain-containing protein [Xanthomonadales bacterium]
MTNQCLQGLFIALFITFAILVSLTSAVNAGGQLESVDITGVVWKWQQTRYNNDQLSVPVESSHYTIEFKPDGTMNIRADCNRGGGNYSTQGKSLTIELTHSTRAMCPPDSLYFRFNKDLGAATIYFFSEGYLYLDLQYDSGTMKFGQ